MGEAAFILLDLTSWREVYCWILLACREVSFASSTGRENEAANLFVALIMIMVLIDRD